MNANNLNFPSWSFVVKTNDSFCPAGDQLWLVPYFPPQWLLRVSHLKFAWEWSRGCRFYCCETEKNLSVVDVHSKTNLISLGNLPFLQGNRARITFHFNFLNFFVFPCLQLVKFHFEANHKPRLNLLKYPIKYYCLPCKPWTWSTW